MTISLRPVTIDNWHAVFNLKVAPSQEDFVASNPYSLAESKFGFPYRGIFEMFPRAPYADEELVGFFMHGMNLNCDRFECFIFRWMVAEPYQRRGYGRRAMRIALEEFSRDPRTTNIGISYNPANHVARKLYAALGFIETGEVFDEESLAIYRKGSV